MAAGAAPAAVGDAAQKQGDVPALDGCQEEQQVAGAGGEERVGDKGELLFSSVGIVKLIHGH